MKFFLCTRSVEGVTDIPGGKLFIACLEIETLFVPVP